MQTLEIVFVRTWWRYGYEPTLFDSVYHWFNLLEAMAWFVFAGLVWIRSLFANRSGKRRVAEGMYSIAFVAFGLTDLWEAWQQSSWLIWIKLINLCLLALLRRHVMRAYYPNAKLY